MKLAYYDADGNAYCLLCDWDTSSQSKEEAERSIREHLQASHYRTLVSSTENGGKVEYYGPWHSEG